MHRTVARIYQEVSANTCESPFSVVYRWKHYNSSPHNRRLVQSQEAHNHRRPGCSSHPNRKKISHALHTFPSMPFNYQTNLPRNF
ncbi:hypothetical protein PspLS_06274 [Pyricularia sp. CBS 133598]|nr:hypothetical protein PspLS_06274 [Pyricularia sp. CBS 133598]